MMEFSLLLISFKARCEYPNEIIIANRPVTPIHTAKLPQRRGDHIRILPGFPFAFENKRPGFVAGHIEKPDLRVRYQVSIRIFYRNFTRNVTIYLPVSRQEKEKNHWKYS